MTSDKQTVMAQSVRSNRFSFGPSNGFETPSHNSFGASNGDDYDSDGSNFAPPYVSSFSSFHFLLFFQFSFFKLFYAFYVLNYNACMCILNCLT